MIIVESTRQYVNRAGEFILKLEDLPKSDPMYQKGFRFKDDQDRTYRVDGTFNIRDAPSKYDLVRTRV